MVTKLEKLMFSISMLDRVSGPANKVVKELDRIQYHAQAGTAAIASGAIGAGAAIYTLHRGLSAAIDQNRSLREVKSLGVDPADLAKLNKMSLTFAARWGEDSAQVAASAYDIQSAIAGLTGMELTGFTKGSAILAKATKADAGTITSYVGTMFGIFEKQANKMGKQQWIEQLVGQSALAVQMFKTTGTEMAGAFGSLGAEATSQNVAMAEQIAILGQLQATMSGSEAGTKYKAFLAGTGKAQKTLGLSFTDSQGKILPMVDILDRIHGKYGDIDTVAKSDLLMKAFGSKEAVSMVKLLMQNTAGLADNINAIGQQTGMDKAIAMAQDMVDPLDQLASGSKAVQAALGQVVLKGLDPLIQSMAGSTLSVLRWIDLFPNVTQVVAMAGLGVLGVVLAVSLLTIAVGISRFLMIGWSVVVKLMTVVLWIYRATLSAVRTGILLFNMAVFLSSGPLAAMKLGVLSLIPTLWGFTAALLANPITWVVLGIVALTAAVIGAVVYWDKLVAVFRDNSWLQTLMFPLFLVIEAVDWLVQNFGKAGEAWDAFTGMFADISPFQLLGGAVDWLIDKLNLIPGINIEAGATLNKPTLASREAGATRAAAGGGVVNRISSAVNNSGRSLHVEKMEVMSGGRVDGATLINEMEMAT